jgi:hypothetical protein
VAADGFERKSATIENLFQGSETTAIVSTAIVVVPEHKGYVRPYRCIDALLYL